MLSHVQVLQQALIWYAMYMASLPSVRITSKICLSTATLMDTDKLLSDVLLSDNLSNSQDTFVKGR